MKVTVKDKYLNIRAGNPSLNADCYQYLAPGSEIEVDGILYRGDAYEGNNIWFKDQGNNYYWSGGVSHNIPASEFKVLSAAADKERFAWFKQLSIETVWNEFTEQGDLATVAVLDTGYSFSNTDLAPKLSSPGSAKNFIEQSVYPTLPMTPEDRSRAKHGTRCAALVGALNSKNWIVGVAPKCKLLVGKISYDGSLPKFRYILEAIAWAIEMGADIISISHYDSRLTGPEVQDFQRQLDLLKAGKNVIIFACSGNSGKPQIIADNYPASFSGVISVGASTLQGVISPVTILSTKTILHAPGEDIESYNDQNVPSPETGTSFSTPIAAGIAALAVSYIKKKNNGRWNAVTLEKQLIDSATPIAGAIGKKIINPSQLFTSLKK